MKITIISIGKFENYSFKDIFEDYLKRLRNVTLKEIEVKNTKNLDVETLKKQEFELIVKNLSKNSIIIALDQNGEEFSSADFSKMLEKYSINSTPTIDFIIGGAFGLFSEIKNKAHKIISLSKMTFPHNMARVILIEQIYRAKTIISNHPYHK